jgi:hypothetical protein
LLPHLIQPAQQEGAAVHNFLRACVTCHSERSEESGGAE